MSLDQEVAASKTELAHAAPVGRTVRGVFVSGMAAVTSNSAVSWLGTRAVPAIIAPGPADAALLAMPVLGEMPSRMEAATIALIISAVVLVS